MGPRARAKTTTTAAAAAEAPAASEDPPVRKRARGKQTVQRSSDDESEKQPAVKAAKVARKSAKQAIAAAVEQPVAASKGAKKAAAKRCASAAVAAERDPKKQCYYLVKSEPHEFSIDQLEANPNQTEGWEGVRNAQARNFLKSMRVGDLAFFYHSSCKVPGIVGIAKVVRAAYPDATQFDSSSKYHDPSSSTDNPKWWQVDFQLVRKLHRQISLEELKSHKAAGPLAGMALFNRPRLSVQPVTQQEWDYVLGLENNDIGSK